MSFEPDILGFACNWCGYAGADSAGMNKLQYPANIKILRVECLGRVDSSFMLQAFEDGYDGLLYLHEIQRKQLGAQLVVLSGCSTAQGVLQPGEGMAGLQYAFRAMGVQSSLATSWYVDDNTTVLLMEAFYRNLQRGLPKDEALQQAQLSLLEDGKTFSANPFLWAAPVLYGDTAPLALEGRPPLWLLWVTLPLLLLFVLYLRHRSIRKR